MPFLIMLLPAACAVAPFPSEKLYVIDVTNQACAEYELVNATDLTFRWIRDLQLLPGGPCDRAVGWTKEGFKKIQNWARDAVKDCQAK